MKYELLPNKRNIPNEDLLNDLKRISEIIHTKKLTTKAYKENGGIYSIDTYNRRFNSWLIALEKAGLEATRTKMNLSIEELFENLAEVWTILQRQPKYSEMRKPISKYGSGVYERRFGTWRKGLEAFVVYMNDELMPITTPINQIKKQNNTPRNVNLRLRFTTFRNDNFKCVICGNSPAKDPKVILHADHIIPWSKGGPTILENLQTLCSICNIGKSDLKMTENAL